ncbi:MAG: signal recognition particle receptor subunit alpha, partial [Bacillota bacterium]
MEKTRQGVFNRLNDVLKDAPLDDSVFDEIEEIFIMADMGVDTVIEFVGYLRDSIDLSRLDSAEDLREIIVEEMFKRYTKDTVIDTNLDVEHALSVVLFVGVNGVGKTTTIAKVAHQLQQEGKKVMMVAGDTFRAGAIEQLRVWSERVGCDFFEKPAGSDPSSVMFDAI